MTSDNNFSILSISSRTAEAVIFRSLNNARTDWCGRGITFNWYWLVDGLMGHGYEVHLIKIETMVVKMVKVRKESRKSGWTHDVPTW